MRSPLGQVAGIHLQGGISREIIRQYGLKNWTVLHQQADIIQTLREEIPDTVVCLRLYDEDWRAVNAYMQGGRAWDYANRFLRPTDMVTPGNEPNIEWNYVVQSAADYENIRDWCALFIRGYKDACVSHGFVPARTCTPALSPGHSEDQEDFPGVIGYRILKPSWDQYDVIGVHCYWDPPGSGQLYDPNVSKFYAFRNVVTARRFYPDKPFWLGEYNGGAQAVFNPGMQPQLAADVRYYNGRMAAEYPYVEGATYFLDESWDQPYQARRMPPVFDEFGRMGHEQDGAPLPPPPGPGVPPPLPPPPPSDTLAAKYGLRIMESPTMGVRLMEVDEMELRATCPPYDIVRISTDDGLNSEQGTGGASVIMGNSSYYRLPNHGPWTITCEQVTVVGAGYGPSDTGSHVHPNFEFYRKDTPMPQFQLAFADYAAAHPEVGQPASDMLYPSVGQTESSHNIAMIGTTKGILVWTGEKVLFIPQDFGGDLQ